MSTTSFSSPFENSAEVVNSKNVDGQPVKRRTASTDSVTEKAKHLNQVLHQIRCEIRKAVKQSGLTMVRARFDTSDIVQESMLQIWKQLDESDIDDLEFTHGLLAVIAKGHAHKQVRFHTAKKRSVSREASGNNPTPTRESNPLDNAAISEEVGLMLNAMSYIHPVRQLIIFRRFFDDASYQQIADEVCRPKEWVRQQCLKAQKEIRTLLMHRS